MGPVLFCRPFDTPATPETPMKRAALILAFALLLTACETLKGVGRDLENTGEAIDEVL